MSLYNIKYQRVLVNSYALHACDNIVLMLVLESQKQPKERAEAEQRSVYNASPSKATSATAQQLLHVELTAANYKSKFRMLMYLEMEQIKNRLSTDVEQ